MIQKVIDIHIYVYRKKAAAASNSLCVPFFVVYVREKRRLFYPTWLALPSHLYRSMWIYRSPVGSCNITEHCCMRVLAVCCCCLVVVFVFFSLVFRSFFFFMSCVWPLPLVAGKYLLLLAACCFDQQCAEQKLALFFFSRSILLSFPYTYGSAIAPYVRTYCTNFRSGGRWYLKLFLFYFFFGERLTFRDFYAFYGWNGIFHGKFK